MGPRNKHFRSFRGSWVWLGAGSRGTNGFLSSLCGLRRACTDVNKADCAPGNQRGTSFQRPKFFDSPGRKGYGVGHMGALRPFYVIRFSSAHLMDLLDLFNPSAGTCVSREAACTKAIEECIIEIMESFLSFAWFSAQGWHFFFFSGHEAKGLFNFLKFPPVAIPVPWWQPTN